jgi:Golgi-resident PAP phosphatase
MNLGGAVKINKCAVLTFSFAIIFIIYVLYFTTSPSSIELPRKSNDKINLRKLMISLILAARNGGDQVLKIAKEADFGGIHTKGKTKEGVNDYLTQADVNSHCSIAYPLWHLFPELNLISEEDVLEKNCRKELQQPFDIDPSILDGVSLPDVLISPDELGPLWIDPLDATKGKNFYLDEKFN